MKEYIMRYEDEVLQLLPDKIQPLVRCSDCKHGEPNDCGEVICDLRIGDDAYRPMKWYCADGERRTGND